MLAHVDELFQTPPGDALSPEQEMRRAQERKQVFRQLQAILKSMDEEHVLLDLPLGKTRQHNTNAAKLLTASDSSPLLY